MNEPQDPPRPAGGKGCGCFAALAFLIVVGLPVLFVFGFGNAPCKDGPCDPDGARNLQVAAAVVVALAALLGLAVWRLVAWRSAACRRRARGRGLELAAVLLLAAAAAAFAGLLFL
jgi:hypothetical protein